MFALLDPHWLVLTGHTLLRVWPWVASSTALVLWRFMRYLERQLTSTEADLHNAEVELIRAQTRSQNTDELRELRAYLHEVEEQLELQRLKCRVEHMDRPLPVRPLSADERQQLEAQLPF